LSKARITDEKVWKMLVKWMNENHRTAGMNDLRYCIGSLALMNVDSKLCAPVASAVASRLQPAPNEDPLKWLNAVWSLATLNHLTPKWAESVLNGDFRKELLTKKLAPDENLFVAQKLCQINAAAKFDLKEYAGPLLKVDDLKFESTPCELLKYGKKYSFEKYKAFYKALTTTIPLATPSKYYPEYGVFIDSLLYYNTETSKFASLSSVPKDKKFPLKGLVAVQYFNERHYTRVYTNEDAENRRLLGAYQMGIRHLQAAGAKVVIIAEHDLEKCPMNVNRYESITEKVKKAAQSN
jgi:hypothetical protein